MPALREKNFGERAGRSQGMWDGVANRACVHRFKVRHSEGRKARARLYQITGRGPQPAPVLRGLGWSTIALILNTRANTVQLRDKIKSRAVLGTFVKLGRREVIEILALAGLDFAICDLEHSQITEAEAGHMVASGKSCGLPVIVRVAHFDPGEINRLLEAGAAGIQLPQVHTRDQVVAFRAACKYPPEGARSVSLAQPAAGYGSEPLAEYMGRSNTEE